MTTQSNKKNIYVAWSNKQDSYSFIATIKTIEEIGCNPVILKMVKSNDVIYEGDDLNPSMIDEHGILLSEYAKKVKEYSWRHSNIEEITKDVDCVIFPGGSDICPTLYKVEEGWHGLKDDTDYSASRDISDYILMSYCLDKDIPMFAICRGMQMLAVVSGGSIISDIPTYFSLLNKNENAVHRDINRIRFVPHDVDVTDKDSLFYRIIEQDVLKNTPSWHHQGILSVENTLLTSTGEYTYAGVKIMEVIERKDLSFCIGVQFHPEVAVRMHIEGSFDKDRFTDYESTLSFFKALKNFKK